MRKIKLRIKRFFLGSVAACFLFTACEPDPVKIKGPSFHGSAGVFILNEGSFMGENESLSFYDYRNKVVFNQVFFTANKVPLGDVAQSMTFCEEKGFIVVNNSAKIWCINADDAIITGIITGLESPRNMLIVNERKAFVSDLYARKIYVVDPNELVVTGSIETDNHSGRYHQHSAEQMVLVDNKIFAACWSFDNMILVIDEQTDCVTDSIVVTKQPNSMVVDSNEDLWILSDGGFPGSSYGVEIPALARINTATYEIEKEFRFPSVDQSPDNLCINNSGDTLYFLNTGVYKMSVYAESLPTVPFISTYGRQFYSLGIDPASSDIYVADAVDYQQEGIIYRYRADLQLTDSFRVGIIPGDFYFTEK